MTSPLSTLLLCPNFPFSFWEWPSTLKMMLNSPQLTYTPSPDKSYTFLYQSSICQVLVGSTSVVPREVPIHKVEVSMLQGSVNAQISSIHNALTETFFFYLNLVSIPTLAVICAKPPRSLRRFLNTDLSKKIVFPKENFTTRTNAISKFNRG